MSAVCVAIADLFRLPGPEQNRERGMEATRLTQLLYGEPVKVLESWKGWLHVEALMQPFYKDESWSGYRGWLLREAIDPHFFLEEDEEPLILHHAWQPPLAHLSLGSVLFGKKSEKSWEVRLHSGVKQHIDRPACSFLSDRWQPFLDTPYLWGGCSAHHSQLEAPASGVDCSSLIHLLFRLEGFVVPRDAHDQSLSATPIREGEQVAFPHLLFLADRSIEDRIGHVVYLASADVAYEGNLDLGVVRKVGTQTLLKEVAGRSATHTSLSLRGESVIDLFERLRKDKRCNPRENDVYTH